MSIICDRQGLRGGEKALSNGENLRSKDGKCGNKGFVEEMPSGLVQLARRDLSGD